MAQVLTAPRIAAATQFWAVDKLVLGYFGFMVLMLAAWWDRIPNAPALLAWHILGGGLVVFQVKRPNPTSWLFRNWYPLPYVASCYKEMANLFPLARHISYDAELAQLDQRLWGGVQPALWIVRIQTPLFTEVLQWVYTFFVPAVLLVAFVLWGQRRYRDFQFYAFLISLGYLASYVGYVLLPARGPRFFFPEFDHLPLQGLWLFQAMQSGLDRLESVAYDAFPSGHTELTILAWWSSRGISRSWFGAYFAYTSAIIFATVYLRYHYTVDVFAGAILSIFLIAAAPFLYRTLQQGG